MTKAHRLATEIVDVFEDLLDEHNIYIPSEEDDQREKDNEAKLYGMTYWNLVEDIEQILKPESPSLPDNLSCQFDDACVGCDSGEYILEKRRTYVRSIEDALILINKATKKEES